MTLHPTTYEYVDAGGTVRRVRTVENPEEAVAAAADFLGADPEPGPDGTWRYPAPGDPHATYQVTRERMVALGAAILADRGLAAFDLWEAGHEDQHEHRPTGHLLTTRVGALVYGSESCTCGATRRLCIAGGRVEAGPWREATPAQARNGEGGR